MSYVEEHFGNCPECGRTDGYINVFKDHYFRCDEHKTVWFVGRNLYSSWRHETEEDWQHNRERLIDYRVVEPV